MVLPSCVCLSARGEHVRKCYSIFGGCVSSIVLIISEKTLALQYQSSPTR